MDRFLRFFNVNNRLYFKYFILFAVNLIFFILVLSYLIYFVFVQSFLQKQYAQANIANLNDISRFTEYFLIKADDVAKYYSIVNKEAIVYQYKDITVDARLYDFLDRQKKQKFINESVYSTYLYYQNKDVLIDLGSSSIYAPASSFFDTEWMNKMKEKTYNKHNFILLDTRKVIDSRFVQSGGEKLSGINSVTQQYIDVISVIRPFENRRENIKGFVVANLKERNLSDYIKESHSGTPQIIFIINSAGKVVSHVNKSLLSSDLTNQGYINTIINSNGNSGFFIDSVNGEKSAIMYVKSNYIDWIYVSIVPYSYLVKNLEYLTRIILIIIVLILLSAVISLFFISIRVYTPIEEIFEKIKRISSEDKAHMVKSEVKIINNLLDNFKRNYDHLGKKVLDNYYLLKFNFLNKLINAEYTSSEISEGLAEYKLSFNKNYYLVACIKIDDYINVLKNCRIQDIYLMKQGIINIAEEFLNEEYTAVGTDYDQRNIALIINTDKAALEKEKFNSYISSIMDMVKKYFNLSISVGIGNVYTALDGLKQSCKEAEIALKNRLHKQREVVIYFDEINTGSTSCDFSGFVEQIIGLIKSGKKAKCLQVLDHLISAIKENDLNHQQVENVFIELFVLVRKQLSGSGISFEDISGIRFGDIIDFVITFETLDALQGYAGDILSRLCDWSAENRKISNEELIAKVIDYIDKHYYQDISLDKIADMLKLTPQYISKLIKDISGTNYLEYLTTVRIQKSEQLLLNTHLSVQEVAERVGYLCYRTFLQHFKMRTGTIPTQYRKLNNKIMRQTVQNGK